jgi:hypothetical protein
VTHDWVVVAVLLRFLGGSGCQGRLTGAKVEFRERRPDIGVLLVQMRSLLEILPRCGQVSLLHRLEALLKEYRYILYVACEDDQQKDRNQQLPKLPDVSGADPDIAFRTPPAMNDRLELQP